MQVEGAAERQGLVEVLLTLGRLRRTGILTIQGARELIGLSFLGGEIVSADALNESPEEGLGEVLASRGLVDMQQFGSLVAEYEAGGGRVTDLLIERGFVDQRDLLEALRWHLYLLSRRALSWSSCEYKFYEGDEVSHEAGIRPLPVEELLVRATDDLGEGGPLQGAMPAADAVYARTNVKELAPGRDELLLVLATGDSDGAAGLLKEIDGRRSAEQVAEKVGVSQYEARLTLFLLERAGQVEKATPPSEERPPSASRKAAVRVAEAGASVAQAGVQWLGRNRLLSSLADKRAQGWQLDWLSWPPRCLGAVLIGLVVWVMVGAPGKILLPFPWQEGLRQAVLDEQTSAAYLKIDRAAKTSFLLDGHFPEALEGLVQAGYLAPSDLVDAAGRSLGYAAQVAGYLVYPLDEGLPTPGASRTEAVTGNFLLDPEFIPARTAAEPPLVLLD